MQAKINFFCIFAPVITNSMLMNRFYYLLLLAVFSLVSPAVQAAGAGTNYLTKLQAEMLRLISTPERDKFLGNLAQYARSLDSTRLISMAMEVTSASNYKNRLQDNMSKYVDVVSFNQYIGWYRDVNDAPKMVWEIPYDKPVIISEFGGGAKYGLHGAKNQRWTEEFQENLYKENVAMLDKIDGLAGTSPWILKDFRSPRRVLNGIQDYYNRKGLYSDKGEKKKAFYVLKQWYEGK